MLENWMVENKVKHATIRYFLLPEERKLQLSKMIQLQNCPKSVAIELVYLYTQSSELMPDENDKVFYSKAGVAL